MKVFKKVFSCILAFAIISLTSLQSVTFAAFNPNKDPNGDGKLTIADYVSLKMILAGSYAPSDLIQCDVDDNGVVSDVDAMYVMMYDAKLISASTPNTDMMNSVNATTISKAYRVYNATTGSYKRNYTLTMDSLENTASTQAVIGPEDRYVDFTKSGVVKLITTNGLSTGFVVDNHTIATAAHCLVNPKNLTTEKVEKILFFDSNGEEINFSNDPQKKAPVTPVEYHIPYDYILNHGTGSYKVCGDYALITVEEDLGDYKIFNLGLMTDAFSKETPLTVTGFPGEYMGQEVNNDEDHVMYSGNGYFESFNIVNGTKTFFHNIDMTPGNSGGPIYLEESVNNQTYFTVVGINISEIKSVPINRGIRFTPDILRFYLNNTNIQY